jgi:pilus assembly protein FimV
MRRARAWILRLLAVLAALAAPPIAAQAPAPSYEVKRGDTLFAIERRTRHPGVTRNQMMLAIVRANPSAFPDGNLNVLAVGTVLALPTREAAAGIPVAEADQALREMLSRPAAPPAPAPPPVARVAPPAPTPPPPARPSAPPLLSPEQAEARYREGVALEHKGDDRGALQAFLAAGESGHGLAQKRLGEIYDKGNAAVARDYQSALRWYQRAREQGVSLPKPIPRDPR